LAQEGWITLMKNVEELEELVKKRKKIEKIR
jgi:hypothetical protein